MNLSEIFEPEDTKPAPRPPHCADPEGFFRKRKEENERRDPELLHQGSPSRPPTLLMPLYSAYASTANVYIRPQFNPGNGQRKLFIAIPEPIGNADHEAVFRRLDFDRKCRERKTPKDHFKWEPLQVRKLGRGEDRSTQLYRILWDFADPMKSLEDAIRLAGYDVDRLVKQVRSGVYVHQPTSGNPRLAAKQP